MTRILIEEWHDGPHGTNARVSFDGGPVYPITISNPFTPEQEQRLAWYFEQYLYFPQLKKVQAQEAAASIIRAGEQLFAQVFADHRAYAAYTRHLSAGVNSLHFELAGSAAFHALHWEALKDPDLPRPFVLDATMVRKNLTPAHVEATVHPSPTINILVVTARPNGRNDVSYRTISRPMIEALRQANLRVRVDLVRPGTYAALSQHLDTSTNTHGVGYYHVIHFDVHGAVLSYEELKKGREANHFVYQTRTGYERPDLQSYTGERAFLFLEAKETGQSEPVAATELAALLTKHQIPVALLNACQSGKMPQAGEEDTSPSVQSDALTSESRESSLGMYLMQAGIQVVLAMSYSVTVSAARLLMTALYQQLFDKRSLAVSIRAARMALANEKARQAEFNQTIDLEDWLLPVVYQNQDVSLTVREFTPEEARDYDEQQGRRYQEPATTYGFVGRDLDVLEIERRLLTKSNLLLIQGMGGAGKSTLLRHLGAWWQTTHLVEQVCYFGYDERSWSRQQIIRSIVEQLIGKARYTREFQSLSPEAQQSKLAAMLRATRHLLILDNLESITGTNLAILHTLSTKEQQALQSFLHELVGGKTLVLLGSRSDEAWLAKGTFDSNRYVLGGLDREAATQLTERILERHHATHHRKEADLRHLLTLLDGFPLALEIVLANLARQTPTEILTALQSGNVSLDNAQGRDKTESIVQCIDYSHNNLSPDAQNLLLCLAPFTSVFNTVLIEDYTKLLQQNLIFATLTIDQWNVVLHEAMQWGLLTPDTKMSQIFHLQPVLPYFLHQRLRESVYQERQDIIEMAFRQLYVSVGDELYTYLQSKNPREYTFGQAIMQFEYENMITALRLALAAHVSILNLYNVLSKYLDRVQEPQRGLALAQMAWEGLQAYPTESKIESLGGDMVTVIDNMAKWYLVLKQHNQAENTYQQALELWQKNTAYDNATIKRLKAPIYHQLGIIAQQRHELEKAKEYYQLALEIKNKFHDYYEQALTYGQLGMLAYEQRKWKQAEQYFHHALRIYEEYHDRRLKALIYQNLGNIAYEQCKWQRAEDYFQYALQIHQEFHDSYGQAMAYHNLGIVAHGQHKWQQATQYYQLSLQLYEDSQNYYELADSYRQLGIIAQEQEQWQQAEQYYQHALHIKEEFHDRYEQARIYYLLGTLAQEQGQWQQAREYLIRALTIFVESKDEHSIGITMYNLARLWHVGGDEELPGMVASVLGVTKDEVEQRFAK